MESIKIEFEKQFKSYRNDQKKAGKDEGLPWERQKEGGGRGKYLSHDHKDAFETLFHDFYIAVKEKRRIPKGSKSFTQLEFIIDWFSETLNHMLMFSSNNYFT